MTNGTVCVHVLNEKLFDYRLEQLLDAVIQKQTEKDYGTTEISFNSGYIKDEEGYKKVLFDEGQKLLNFETWTEDDIGTGLIRDCVLKAIRQKMPGSNDQQNLLDWRVVDAVVAYFSLHLQESESLIYTLYKDEKDQFVFDNLCSLWGDRYPILGYLFFLKDRSKYLPVKPDIFKKRFAKVGITTDCLRKCTWDNYQGFIEIMQAVQERLMLMFDDEVELLDAHSFVWMMWHIEDVPPREDIKELINRDENTSVVFSGKKGKEGAKKQYYVTKYERNPRLRKAALAIHGYTCMACGFNFEDKYGARGKNYIEVHHIKPLAEIGEEVEVDPETDLICLCSNCHRIVHRKTNYVLSLEELKTIISE